MKGKVLKIDGTQKNVRYMVLELGTAELFDYVKFTGGFSEPLARFYFRQLIEGIDRSLPRLGSQGPQTRQYSP